MMTAQFELVQKENTDSYHNGISGENKTKQGCTMCSYIQCESCVNHCEMTDQFEKFSCYCVS